jgi:hypothetical protein
MDIKEHWFMVLVVALLILWTYVHKAGATTDIPLYMIGDKGRLISVPYTGDIEPVIGSLPTTALIRVALNVPGPYDSVSDPLKKNWTAVPRQFYWAKTNKKVVWVWNGEPLKIPQSPKVIKITSE